MLAFSAVFSAIFVLALIIYRVIRRGKSALAENNTLLGIITVMATVLLSLAIWDLSKPKEKEEPFQNGINLLKEGRLEDVLEFVDQELIKDPTALELQALRGEVLIRLGRLVEAGEALELARDDPDLGKSPGLLLALGFAQDRLGRPILALEAAQALLISDPENLAALVLASRCFLTMGQTARAEYHARQAARVSPDDGLVVANLARVEARAGKLEDAYVTLRKARDLGYNRADTLEATLPFLAGTPLPEGQQVNQPRANNPLLGLNPPPPNAPGGEEVDGLSLKIWSEKRRYRMTEMKNIWIILANSTMEPYKASYFYESELVMEDDRGERIIIHPMSPVSDVPAFGLSLGIFGDIEDNIRVPGRYSLHWTLGPIESNTIVIIVDPD